MLDGPHVDSLFEKRLAELCARSGRQSSQGVHCMDLRSFRLTLTLTGRPTGLTAAAPCPGEETPSSTSDGPQTKQTAPSDVVQRVRLIARERSALEARLLGAAQDLTAEIGAALLADKGYADVDELTSTHRRRWRAETKRLACAELQVALGLGVKEARQLVGVACAPAQVRTVVGEALDTGLASWGHVRAFWERCGTLPADEAALVSESLFGADPDMAVAERLAPDGTLLDRPWHQAEFWAALEREAVRVEGQDVVAERERRHRARAERRLWMRVDDDSTATLGVTGPLTSLCAISQRIDACAKALRKSGDDRTLAQLRSDVAQTLLLHGRLDLPDQGGQGGQDEALPPNTGGDPLTLDTGGDPLTLDTGGDPLTLDTGEDDLLTPARSERVAQIVTAQPSITLQVVVPFDALTGRAACASCASRAEEPQEQPDDCPGDDPPPAVPPLTSRGEAPPPFPAARGAVGEVLGHHPAFISPGHIRELALAPGTTLSRLLVDPADGRLIERSIACYRPDAAMRRQIVAADVYSRAPGSRAPAIACEIDHEQPYGAGGPTSEINLGLKDVRSHQFKTKGWWRSGLTPRRDLTWETILGQVEQTRGHDYRQYLPSMRTTTPTADESGQPTLEDDLDLACRALYAALAHRGVGALLADPDDADGATDHDPRLTGWITLTHRGRDGQRRGGPREGLATVAGLLGFGLPRGADASDDGPDTKAGPDSAESPSPRREPRDEPPPF